VNVIDLAALRERVQAAREQVAGGTAEMHERAKHVAEYMIGDARDDSEMPLRFRDAALGMLAPELFNAVGAVLGTLPDVYAAILERIAEADAIGNPDLMARMKTREIARLVSGANVRQLWISGKRGVGKTYALAAMLNAATGRMIPGRLVSITAIIKELQATFDRDREERTATLLGRYENTPLLVLDDIDKMYMTDWSTTFLFDLVNARSERRLPTFTSSNLTPQKILGAVHNDIQREQVGAAIDRLMENAETVIVEGASRRR
jgi:DNA replication protein DnaC